MRMVSTSNTLVWGADSRLVDEKKEVEIVV